MVCGDTGTVAEALRDIPAEQPDMVISDIVFDGERYRLMEWLCAQQNPIPVMVLTNHRDTPSIINSFESGAMGYFLKTDSSQVLLEAVWRVLELKKCVSPEIAPLAQSYGLLVETIDPLNPLTQLSAREMEVFRYLGEGLRRFDIASQMGVSVKTVGAHIERIKSKLNFPTAGGLVQFAIRWTIQRRSR